MEAAETPTPNNVIDISNVDEAMQAIPEELTNSIKAVVALENVFHLLSEAGLPYTRAKTVEASLIFIKSLHQSTLETVQNHPNYDLVKEHFNRPQVSANV